MHSMDYLLKEAQHKLQFTEGALERCYKEREKLEENFTLAIQDINESLNRHLETLQCRLKWLNCHAESIFHLKEDALSKQINDLECLSGKLRKCLILSEGNANDMRESVKNTLKLVHDTPMLILECSSLFFHADNEQLENMIVNFGGIDVKSTIEDDLESCSDEDEQLFAWNAKTQRKSIEMEVKSIEMRHLTSKSACVEQDRLIDKLEIELQDLNRQSIDENNPWLISTSTINDQSEKECFSDDHYMWLRSVYPDKTEKHVYSDDCEWLLNSNVETSSNTLEKHHQSSAPGSHLDLPLFQYMYKCNVSDDGDIDFLSSDSHGKDKTTQKYLCNSSSNLDHMDDILQSPETNYLQSNSNPLFEKSNKISNKILHHMNFILTQPKETYLRQVEKKPDHWICNWLIGDSASRCSDCTSDCSYEDAKEKCWLRTATNW